MYFIKHKYTAIIITNLGHTVYYLPNWFVFVIIHLYNDYKKFNVAMKSINTYIIFLNLNEL
jgi:hypothetical protein